MAERLRHQGLPVQQQLLARLQLGQCQLPACCCPHALLFIWRESYRCSSSAHHKTRVCWELRTRDGRRVEGGAATEDDAVKFGSATLAEQGLARLRVVAGRPVEVARA